MTEPDFYSLAQAAQVLGVHYETIARWVRTGKLHGVKLSRRKVVVPKETLDDFRRGSRAAPPPDAPSEAGSPRRWLALIQTLTPEEAAVLRTSAADFGKIEGEV